MATSAIGSRAVHFEAVGSGEPVVLLHSGGASSRQWTALMSLLSDRFHCLAPDLPGHGASPEWQETYPPTLASDAEIVDAVVGQVSEPLHLVGHSHGGAVAIAYAVRKPERIASLTLVEPTLMHLLRLTGDPDVWREAHDLGTRHIDAVAAGESARIADIFLPYWIGDAAWAGMPDSRRSTIVATMPAVALFWKAVFAETTAVERYREMEVPTLLIRGGETRATTRSIIDLLGSILPNSRTLVVSGAGHMVPLTHPDAVNGAIEDHLIAHREATTAAGSTASASLSGG